MRSVLGSSHKSEYDRTAWPKHLNFDQPLALLRNNILHLIRDLYNIKTRSTCIHHPKTMNSLSTTVYRDRVELRVRRLAQTPPGEDQGDRAVQRL